MAMNDMGGGSLEGLIDQLRERKDNSRRADDLRRQSTQFAGLAQGAGPGYTPAGNSQANIGGSPINIPQQQSVDWGSILAKAGGNYMAAKKDKEATDLDRRNEELSQQFFETTMRDDPQAKKLYGLAQMGMPGADKALTAHLAPKKEALGAITQFIAGGGDPAMAAELAPRFGLDPELAANAAKHAQQMIVDKDTRKFDQQKQLRGLTNSAADARQNRSIAAADARAARKGPGGRIGIGEGLSEPNDVNSDLTAGERQLRAKELSKLDTDIMGAESQIQKYAPLREMLENDDTFGVQQKTADILAKSPISVLSTIGTSMRNKSAVMLEDYLNSETLKRMAQLGGNDSNEELNRMRASLPQVANNKEAALALMDQLHEWQEKTQKAIEMRREDYATGRYFKMGKQKPNYYKDANPAPAAPAVPAVPATLAPPKGKIKILSID